VGRVWFPPLLYLQTFKEQMKIAIFDFETTDSDPMTCRITEAACAIYDSDTKKVLMSFSSLCWDESYDKIHPTASKITGLTDDLISRNGQAPRFVLAQIGAFFAQSDSVCGHNIRRFDINVLQQELKRNSLDIVDLPTVIDTRFDIEYPDHIETRKLGYLALEHGIFAGDAHAALSDVYTCASLLFRYPLDRTLELAKCPEIYIRADVSFDNKDKAKERKYNWDGANKIWVKQIKEIFYDKEKEESSFPVLKLPSYSPPEK
jgi:DNA polymerase-3 subunit epsilon